jgi:RNA recognition motif-containing protein
MSALFVGFGVRPHGRRPQQDICKVGTVGRPVGIDRNLNQSKGFGFVEMETEEDAQNAIKLLNGSESGRCLIVKAKPMTERPANTGQQPPAVFIT